MRLNENITKEMLKAFKGNPLETQPLLVNNKGKELATNFKIFEVWLSDTPSWNYHVYYMTSRASPLYIMSGSWEEVTYVSRDDLPVYYKTMVRPILKYACPAWHAGLTAVRVTC